MHRNLAWQGLDHGIGCGSWLSYTKCYRVQISIGLRLICIGLGICGSLWWGPFSCWSRNAAGAAAAPWGSLRPRWRSAIVRRAYQGCHSGLDLLGLACWGRWCMTLQRLSKYALRWRTCPGGIAAFGRLIWIRHLDLVWRSWPWVSCGNYRCSIFGFGPWAVAKP